MQVSVESSKGLERKIKVAVPEAQIAEAVENRLKNLSRTVKLKGFRAGKVPMAIVKQHYGPQVRQEVMGELLQSSFYEAVSKEKMRPAGQPNFEAPGLTADKGLEYTATFEVYPEIKLAEFSGEILERPTTSIQDADIDQVIENIRKQHSQWESADRAAELGDRLTVDYTGTLDGTAFSGGTAQNTTIELGKGRLIKGFEEGLVGIKAGEERTLNLTFPETYHAKELAGKATQFAVKVHKVEGPKLPELDDAFVKQLGISEGTLEKLRAEVRENMQRELDNTLKGKLKTAVMDKLLAIHKIDLPAALIESESENLVAQMTQNLANQGMRPNDIKLTPDMFKEQAERRVALGLILAELVKVNNLKADPVRVRTMVEEIAKPYERPEEVMKWYFSDTSRLGEVESLVLEEQVVDLVAAAMKSKEKNMAFNELMYPEKNN